MVVGLPETSVRESRDRVRSAIINAGFEFPQRRITINLAPGDIPKFGTRFDLAIAVSILAASNQVPVARLSDHEFVAELALDGSLRPTNASVAVAAATVCSGRALVTSKTDAERAALVPDARVLSAPGLADVVAHLSGTAVLTLTDKKADARVPAVPDLNDVLGQQQAVRALEVAASGAHNLLMIGPPGTGKSMLAARLPGLLPPLSPEQALECATLHSVADVERSSENWFGIPFRSPHHSASPASITGGGRYPRPGEMSLAHHGVLFFDELAEFDRRALESLREPLELKVVSIARAGGRFVFPADFQFVAAMNPCPCGYLDDPEIECQCSPQAIQRHRNKLSGPLTERIDLQVQIPRQTEVMLQPELAGERSQVVATRVRGVRELQLSRQGMTNSALDGQALHYHCVLDSDARGILQQAIKRLSLSARGHHKILRIARTLADMEAVDRINARHLLEAIGYRRSDRGSPV